MTTRAKKEDRRVTANHSATPCVADDTNAATSVSVATETEQASKLPSLIRRFWSTFERDDYDMAIPDDIVGATITDFGTFSQRNGADGRLVIEYRPENSSDIKRAVIGFTDTDMWLDSEHSVG